MDTCYETYLNQLSLNDVVLAYRGGIGYNVPFAKSLFDEIRRRGNCRVICLDISGFFDNISHEILKANLCNILEVRRLSDDLFKVFTRLTKYEYVLRDPLEAKLGKLKGPRICDIETFRRAVRPLIEINQDEYGIPQGTPLSGLLANISMIDFDFGMYEKITTFDGSYRRYSDDIAIVLPNDENETSIMEFGENLLKQHGLSLQHNKTRKTTFYISTLQQNYAEDMLQYLGFTFDGSKILIRPESIKNFYARMKRNIDRYVRAIFGSA